jgi:hypothetical protein
MRVDIRRLGLPARGACRALLRRGSTVDLKGRKVRRPIRLIRANGRETLQRAKRPELLVVWRRVGLREQLVDLGWCRGSGHGRKRKVDL